MTDTAVKPALDGIRVLDVATFIAAPYAASILGEFGAEVLKVEKPNGGDPWRHFGTETSEPGMSLSWLTEARNKKSITLNLQNPEGVELFKRLVADADVVCENFRPGTFEKWGLGWDVLNKINPGLILMRISGYGQTGPYRDRPGFARIGHAVGGLTHLSGVPGQIPVTPGSTSLGDYMSGMYGVIGIMMALRHRDATGQGQVIDMALYESVFRVLDEIAPRYALEGHIREPEGTGTVNACPHGHFQTADGRYMAIACTTDKMFERLCAAMKRPDLHRRYGVQAVRLANRDIVIGEVETWTRSQDRTEIMRRCIDQEVPAGPINSIADIFADPQFEARDNIITIPVPGIGDVPVPGVLPKLSRTPGEVRSLGPVLGNGNEDIYGVELGLSEKERARLKSEGTI